MQVAWLRKEVATELKVGDLAQLKMVWEGRVLTDPETIPVFLEGMPIELIIQACTCCSSSHQIEKCSGDVEVYNQIAGQFIG